MNSMSNGTRTPQNNVPAGRAADRLPRVDPYGFERSVDFDYDSYEELMSEYLVVLTRRSIKWSKLLQRGNKLQKNVKVKRYVRKGIPNEYRALTWMAASGAQEQLEKNPGYYHALLTGEHDARLVEVIRTGYPEPPFTPTLISIFASNMSSFLMIVSLLATSGLMLIHYMAKNLHRTFPDNVQFQKTSNPCLQKALFNVLLAYGHHDKAVGYCQGMNFIAGYLIIITKDEEKSFWLLDALLGRILPDYYTLAMLGLKTDQEVLGELVRVKVPAVWQAMTEHNVMWTLVVSRWFICLFIDVLPVETVLRIWDSLFYEGSKIIFRVALTLIKHNEAFILQARSFPDICDHFKQITKGALVEDCHGFMQKIFAEPGSLSMGTIQKLRESCRARIVAEESR